MFYVVLGNLKNAKQNYQNPINLNKIFKMEALKTIVITGSNKGIGLGIAENLFQKPYQIILACRNLELATKAKAKLEAQFPSSPGKLLIRELDITSAKSIQDFADSFEKENVLIDVLLNNAGIAYKGDAFDENVVRETLQTNFYGTVEFTEKMLKNIKYQGKVVFIGSSAGKSKILKSQDLANRFNETSITRDKLFALAGEFISDVKQNTYEKNGWPKWGYGVSKLLVNNYARALSHYQEVKEKKLQVYTCCPGWVKTDMAGDKAPLTIPEGVLTPVYLVELPFEVNEKFQGNFFYKLEVASILE